MKKLLTLFTTIALLFTSAVTGYASAHTSSSADLQKTVKLAFSNLIKSPSALAAAIVFCVAVLLILIFSKKLRKVLNNSSASALTNTFIVFFSVFGIATLAMAFSSDGETWSNLMHHSPTSEVPFTQFEFYLKNLLNAGSQQFHLSAETTSPFLMLVFFILAQFMPPRYIFSDSLVEYILILRNQQFMFLYLLLAVFIVVLIYRMNRYVLRRNSLNIRDEVVSFLLVVSYPAIFCIEKGDFVAISLVLSMLFIVFRQSEKTLFRELSLVALAVSAAITPCTIIFALLLFTDKNKKSLACFARTVIYFLILFITPAIFTGFDNLLTYLRAYISVNANGYIAGNTSIVNLIHYLGITNSIAVYAIFIITQLIAVFAMIKLPHTWQKATAAAYFMLNIFSVSDAAIAIFIFIPFVFLLAEKKHTAINWVYLGTYALIITPFPEWFRYDSHRFTLFLTSLGVDTVYNANNLISLAAVQLLLILLICQSISAVVKSAKEKKIPAQATEAAS